MGGKIAGSYHVPDRMLADSLKEVAGGLLGRKVCADLTIVKGDGIAANALVQIVGSAV